MSEADHNIPRISRVAKTVFTDRWLGVWFLGVFVLGVVVAFAAVRTDPGPRGYTAMGSFLGALLGMGVATTAALRTDVLEVFGS